MKSKFPISNFQFPVLPLIAGAFAVCLSLPPSISLAQDALAWTKYDNTIPVASDTTTSNGRLPEGLPDKGDDALIYDPVVLKDGAVYKMWYVGYDGAKYRLYHATSTNGLDWTKYDNTIPTNSDTTSHNGRIPLGTTGGAAGDTNIVWTGSVIKDGSTYKMWYSGYAGVNYRGYYATSTNGLDWTKYDNTAPTNSDTTSSNGRIPLGTPGKGDSSLAIARCVIKDGADYKMWYVGSDGFNYRIYYATSSNGLDWTKYDNTTPTNSNTTSSNGRIPIGTNAVGDDVHVNVPCVIKDGSIYKMWYTGYDGATWRIYYATSTNGLDWTKQNNIIPAPSNGSSDDGRIPLGGSGRGDNTHTRGAWVIKDGATYKMWYTGYDGANYRIYYATSSDGLIWNKYDNFIPNNADANSTSSNGRVPLGKAARGDAGSANPGAVIKEDSTYKMWYTGYDGVAYYRIYYATSPDGLVWTKYNTDIPSPTNSGSISSNGCIPLGLNTRGDDYYVSAPSVIKDGATYKMWYTGYDGAYYRIYYATSSNGLDWAKYDNTIPTNSDTTSDNGRIPLGTNGPAGDDAGVVLCCVIKDGAVYKMWYTGSDGSNWRIYHATSSNGLDWTKYDNTIPANSDTTSSNGHIPLGTAGRGDSGGAYGPWVIKDGATYKIWYGGWNGSNWRTYYATSSNGLDWVKYDNTVPSDSNGTSSNGRLPLGTAGRGDSVVSRDAYVIKDGTTYKAWYLGQGGGTNRIYYATFYDGNKATAVLID